jgi:hypothetical protein
VSRRLRPNRRSKFPPSKRQYELEWGSDPDVAEEAEIRDEDLPGTVFAVPDRLWGFEAVGRDDHPGVCAACAPEALEATLVKGRDASTDRGNPRDRFLVEPSRLNGLRKLTAFELVPLYRSLRRVRLLYPNRRMGTLEPDSFAELRRRLTRLFPFEG